MTETFRPVAPDLGAGGSVSDDRLQPVRSGMPPWRSPILELRTVRLSGVTACDVVIVGGGITGALTAEALTRQGRSVRIVDRAFPGHGSTAASTAMLLWEIDTPLTELADLYGFDKAAAIYRRSLAAAQDLGGLIAGLGIDCAYARRPSLYLAEADAPAGDLLAEHHTRARAGLPGAHLERAELRQSFGMDRPAAIVADGAAEADPLRLAHGLLDRAFQRGAGLVVDEVVDYQFGALGAAVSLASGAVIEAETVVLATGYDMPGFVASDLQRIVSTWCVATVPQDRNRIWLERALLWEAADPYLYARFDATDRLLIGGEDASIETAEARERWMPAKAERLVDRMRGLQPQLDFTIGHAWTAAFGETADGLPLIGPVPGAPRALAAYGYGGNGITFSYMAAQMIAARLAGTRRDWFDDYALDR
jgi:glycine/D-amino acid oxidase-like deaminating enzyme